MEPFAITIDEAAGLAHIGKGRLREWARNDKTFPAFAVGSVTLIPVDSFRAWINERGRLRVDMPTPVSPIAKRIKANRKHSHERMAD